MKKAKTKKQGGYCPKRPGYSWAHLPKEDPAEESAGSEPGSRPAK